MKITDKMRLNYIKKAILRPDLTWNTGMPVHVPRIFKSGNWSLSPGSYQHGHKTFRAALDAAVILSKKRTT